MKTRFRQTGAFILVTVIFLMVAGGALLYAMANLSTVSSATNSVAHNGNMALAAAQSGLKYCVAWLETGACPVNPAISGVSCEITVADGGCNGAVAPLICTVTSTAYCPNSTDANRGGKALSIQVQKTTNSGVTNYQMIPASRQVRVLP